MQRKIESAFSFSPMISARLSRISMAHLVEVVFEQTDLVSLVAGKKILRESSLGDLAGKLHQPLNTPAQIPGKPPGEQQTGHGSEQQAGDKRAAHAADDVVELL